MKQKRIKFKQRPCKCVPLTKSHVTIMLVNIHSPISLHFGINLEAFEHIKVFLFRIGNSQYYLWPCKPTDGFTYILLVKQDWVHTLFNLHLTNKHQENLRKYRLSRGYTMYKYGGEGGVGAGDVNHRRQL